MPTAARATVTTTHDPGIANFWFGVVCLTICASFATFGMFEFVGGERIGFVVAFSLGALGFLGWTVHSAATRHQTKRVYCVERDEVCCYDGTRLLWREPKQAYREILWVQKTELMRGGHGGSYTLQVLTLPHAQADRTVPIHRHQDAARIRECSELWARALDLPVHRPAADLAMRRSASELTKPLVAISAEVHFIATFDFGVPPPKTIACGTTANGMWVKARLSWFLLWIALAASVAALALVEPGDPDATNMVMTWTCIAFAAVVCTLPLVARQVTSISRAEIVSEYRILRLPVWRQRIPLDAIVQIYSSRGNVILEARTRSLRIRWLGTAAQSWLTGFLRGVILERRIPT